MRKGIISALHHNAVPEDFFLKYANKYNKNGNMKRLKKNAVIALF